MFFFLKNEIPIHQPHEIDTRYHLLDDALSKWQLELAKISDDENEHKIIAAHASSMVPFGIIQIFMSIYCLVKLFLIKNIFLSSLVL